MGTNETLDAYLNFDALSEAEKITGESYKESQMTSGIGMLMMIRNNAEKEVLLKSLGDSFYGMKWADFKALLEAHGFSEIHSWVVPDTEDQGFLYVDTDHTVLVSCNSYGDVLNDAQMYYEVKFPEGFARAHLSSGHLNDSDHWVGYHDIRDAFLHKLQHLKDEYLFVPMSQWDEKVRISPSRYKGTADEDACILAPIMDAYPVCEPYRLS